MVKEKVDGAKGLSLLTMMKDLHFFIMKIIV